MAGASLDIRGKGQKQVSDIIRKEKGQGLEWFAFHTALPFHSKGVTGYSYYTLYKLKIKAML